MTETRPWMPAMMLREIAEGAPRLDPDTMAHMRGVIGNFAAILKQGQDSGEFRDVHPILAYESIVGPIIINAARERVAEQPARKTQGFPLLVAIPHADRNRARPGDGAKDAHETMKRDDRSPSRFSPRPARNSHRRIGFACRGTSKRPRRRLASEAGGRILTLTVKEGDRVQPGQTILTLDTRDAQLAINRVKAEQAAAEAQLRLVQAGSRVEDIRQAQAQVETARSEVSAARSELQCRRAGSRALRHAAQEQLGLAQAARRCGDEA